MAAITRAGESLIAQKTADQQTLVVSKFIFALVPGLDPEQPVDRDAGKPPADQIMLEQDIARGAYVNPNQVVYSTMIGSDVGDWDFNWIGLETAEGVLLAVAYAPTQQKRKNIPNRQIGNNITRNILLMFDGAQSITDLTIDAQTWQADFTVRLAGIDERERLANRDWFGRASFFGDGLMLRGGQEAYQLVPGMAYLEGLPVKQGPSELTPPEPPFTLWYDVSLQRDLNETKVMAVICYGEALTDFVDSDGAMHYLVPVARVTSPTDIVDLRDSVEPIEGPLIQSLAARSGDYPQLRARATTKDDVGLGNLPNAKSDDPDSNSSEVLATTAAVFAVRENIGQDLGSAAQREIGTAIGNLPEYLEGGLSGYGYGAGNIPPKSIDLNTVASVNGQIAALGSSSANGPPGLEIYGGIVEFFHGASGCLLQRVTLVAPAGVGVGGQIWQRSRYDASQAYGPWVNMFKTSSMLPIGAPIPWPSVIPPAGFLSLAGQGFNWTQYPELAAVYPGLVLPDMRGEFIRGWDNGRGVNPGRGLLTVELDQYENHTHYALESGWVVHGGNATGGAGVGFGLTGVNSAVSGKFGTETRPRNLALNYVCRAL